MKADLVLRNGRVLSGRNDEEIPVKADVAIKGDTISDITGPGQAAADEVLDIEGLCVCPGFIDVHSHSDFTLLADGRAEAKICQGITTEINGNCGMSAAPLYGKAIEQREMEMEELGIRQRWHSFTEYFSLLERAGIAVNTLMLAGHGSLRASAAGYSDAPLTDDGRRQIEGMMEEAVSAGVKGLSAGLIYPPGLFSDTRELSSLAASFQKKDGIFSFHMRSEGDELPAAIDEVITVAEDSGIHVHISHFKTNGQRNWGKLKEAVQKIDNARSRGLEITCDRYPYIASNTDLDSLLPARFFEGGRKQELARLRKERKRLENELLASYPDPSFWDGVFITSVAGGKNKWAEGKSMSRVSGICGKSNVQCLIDLLIDEELQAGAIFFSMSEENLRDILRLPYVMMGTDSSARSFSGITAKGVPHPRGFGSCPRILGTYVREQKILGLGEAVYKMTGLPASTFHIDRRGAIAPGYYADLVVFDAERVQDRADFSNPFCRPAGIVHVIVNGKPVVRDGECTGARPGRVLRA